jgi:hypothetical protein
MLPFNAAVLMAMEVSGSLGVSTMAVYPTENDVRFERETWGYNWDTGVLNV